MFCANCGSRLARDDAAFCTACGTRALHPSPKEDVVVVGTGTAMLASRWQRVGALAVDLVIIWVVASVPFYVILLSGDTLEALNDPACHDEAGRITSACQDELSRLIAAALILYPVTFLYWWASNSYGASPGRLAVGIRIVTKDGARPGIGRGLARTAVSIASWSAFALGYLWAFWDSRRQTWHDKAAGTYVIRRR